MMSKDATASVLYTGYISNVVIVFLQWLSFVTIELLLLYILRCVALLST